MPEEFIQFDGVDSAGGGDASIHKEPESYWKQFFALITLENSEEDSKISDPRLLLKPFAKKVFQYLDENNDGTITLIEAQNALKSKETQKKLGSLICQHESEWVESLDRWRYIEQFIPEAKRFDWNYEKEKIQELAWWDEVKCSSVSDFPSGDAFYFHPAGFVGNFLGGGGCCNPSENYIYNTTLGDFCFYKGRLDWLMDHEGYRKTPYIPGVHSGITLGFGYDLGHQTKDQALIDLNKYYSASNVKKLLTVVGLTKTNAKKKLSDVSSVQIDRAGAKEMLKNLLGRYAQQTVSAFPEVLNLHPFCQVAMVSLVYNRGAKVNDKKGSNRRSEMKNIQVLFKKGEYDKIPNEIVKMKRIWANNKDARGLLRRRDEEAELFLEGLKHDC